VFLVIKLSKNEKTHKIKEKKLTTTLKEQEIIKETAIEGFDQIVRKERYTLQMLRNYQDSIANYIRDMNKRRKSSGFYNLDVFDFKIIPEIR